MRFINRILFTACILSVIAAVFMTARQQVTKKRFAVWTRSPATLRVAVRRELGTLGAAAVAKHVTMGAPPPTLAELLDRIDQGQRAYIPLLNSGSDWWETPFHYEILTAGQTCSNLRIRSYGANRKNDGGTGDDVQINMTFSKR